MSVIGALIQTVWDSVPGLELLPIVFADVIAMVPFFVTVPQPPVNVIV